MTANIIAIAVIAWIGQIILGWYQLKSFNHALALLSEKGQVGIGRSGGGFRSRVLIAIAVDEKSKITAAIIMTGITIFARPKALLEVYGLSVTDLEPARIFPTNQPKREALTLAITPKI
ncbi:transcriptional regulator GutM [Xenorhabdus sp. Flor]|uniref:transcriptional regulator GutM n=1 Tax=Xenorhabdus cabanillasii TaxID=351673 RepID=UPI0019890686|nr:transcriptional regulator GutM [Xenorhabdus sp. Flor]MBD2814436.1 transcriptional regulator GutM [Xenorhabdus sp. Flor]